MSKTYRGTTIDKVVGATVTEDGGQVMFGLQSAAGEDLALLLPAVEVQKLMLLAVQTFGEAQRKASGGRAKTALEVTRWNLGNDAGTGQIVLMLNVGDTEMVFRLPQRDRQAVLAALTEADAAGQPEADPSKLN